MNREEQIQYLANIYHVLAADGGVDRIEDDVFELIRREIGAGYFEKQEAMALGKKQDYQVRLVGRWSQRVRNLEDMLFAAYCNGVFPQAEKKAVLEYAAQLGIDQRQFDLIKEETRRRYAQYQQKAS